MVAELTFVNREAGNVMVVLRDAGGDFRFFAGVIDNFMRLADPTTLRLETV